MIAARRACADRGGELRGRVCERRAERLGAREGRHGPPEVGQLEPIGRGGELVPPARAEIDGIQGVRRARRRADRRARPPLDGARAGRTSPADEAAASRSSSCGIWASISCVAGARPVAVGRCAGTRTPTMQSSGASNEHRPGQREADEQADAPHRSRRLAAGEGAPWLARAIGIGASGPRRTPVPVATIAPATATTTTAAHASSGPIHEQALMRTSRRERIHRNARPSSTRPTRSPRSRSASRTHPRCRRATSSTGTRRSRSGARRGSLPTDAPAR